MMATGPDSTSQPNLWFQSRDPTGNALVICDPAGRILWFAPSAERIFQYAGAEVIGQPLRLLFAECEHARLAAQMAALAGSGAQVRAGEPQRLTARHKDGTEFPVESSIAWTALGAGGWFVVVLCDLTGTMLLRRHAALLERIIEQSAHEIYVFDAASLRFLMVNRAARENLGYELAELRGMTPADVAPEFFSPEELRQLLAPLIAGAEEQRVFETTHLRKDGSVYDVEVRIQVVPDEDPPILVAHVRDVTERHQYESLMRRQTHYDPLTLLPNRTLFMEHLQQAVENAHRSGSPGGLLLIDVSDTRLVTESLGRSVADRLSQDIALRLWEALNAATCWRAWGRRSSPSSPPICASARRSATWRPGCSATWRSRSRLPATPSSCAR